MKHNVLPAATKRPHGLAPHYSATCTCGWSVAGLDKDARDAQVERHESFARRAK